MNYTVQLDTKVQADPARVSFSWPVDSYATGYTVYRKGPDDASWGSAIGTLAGTATAFVDTGVTSGAAYEYRFVKSASGFTGYTYIAVGLAYQPPEDSNSVLLLIDETYQSGLSSEIARLQADLAGDGWKIHTAYVGRNLTPVAVKALITARAAQDPYLTTLFLIGHVPVPYSGSLMPDGHSNHSGAWPADVYYGEMDGSWTDTIVTNTSASWTRNHNVPGDGKFDQSMLPSDVDLQVGRVDLYDMLLFGAGDLELTRQYLDKNHAYRTGSLSGEHRGLIDDNFGTFGGEAFAATGWRNSAALFGGSSTQSLDFTGTLISDSHIFAYGCGGGSFTSASGVGSSTDFANNAYKTVFTVLFGSYFGDWDSTNNFLRAPLASSGDGLTCAWGGRPHWVFHHMGIGRTVGHSTRLTQNNSSGGLYVSGYSARNVHIALMGDPTLRLHVVSPVSNLTLTPVAGTVVLGWTASPDDVIGYDVYRRAGLSGDFVRLNSQAVTGLVYTDTSPLPGENTYMVRAIKLEQTGSGTYYNRSTGILASLDVGPAPPSGLRIRLSE